MADTTGDSRKVVYNIEASNCKYMIVGDNNVTTIQLKEDDVDHYMTRALNILPKLTTLKLPGKPFHFSFERSREVEEMWSLFEKMNDKNEARVTSLFLTGPPGSGKTQLARQFGERFLKDKSDCNDHCPVVLTINVESVKTLLKSTKDLLNQLKLPKTVVSTTESEEIKVVQLHMEELRKILIEYPGKWLLILDNMFSAEDFKEILPQAACENWGAGKIIVTSQNADLRPSNCHQYAENYSLKNGLEEHDALELLHKISGLTIDEYAKDLAGELELFPLSLACAATYVSQMITDRPSSKYSWKKFLKTYREHNPKFRSFEANNTVYRHSMDVVARLAVTRLAGYSKVLRHAFDFLSYCTTSPVPLVIVFNYVKAAHPGNAKSDDEIKAEISRCSLLSNSCSSVESIQFHQVMGKAFAQVRDERQRSEEERKGEYMSLLSRLQKNLEEAIPDYTRDNVSLKIAASPHFQSIVKHGEDKEWTESADFVVIVAFLADFLYHVPGVTEAERIKYSKLACEIASRLPEPMKNIHYCYVLKTLAFYYREANRLEDAVNKLGEALKITEDAVDKTEDAVDKLREALKLTEDAVDKTEDAVDKLRGDLKKAENERNKWKALKSSILNVLSWTYKLQKKFDLAEQTMKESIDLAKTSFGDSHQEVIERLCNFAIIYRDMQDLPKAIAIVDEARQMAETSEEDLKLTRAQAANYSAKIYLRYAEETDCQEKKKDLLNDSLKFHADALTIYEKVLGENHIYVAGVCMTYAVVCNELNDYNRALELVELAERIYGNVEHAQLNSCRLNKAEILLAQRKVSDAENAITEIRDKGGENSDLAHILLSDVYYQQGKYEESKARIQKVLTSSNSSAIPQFRVKRAKRIRQLCDLKILQHNFCLILPKIILVVVVYVAVFLDIWYSTK